jgi:hypothetical protein
MHVPASLPGTTSVAAPSVFGAVLATRRAALRKDLVNVVADLIETLGEEEGLALLMTFVKLLGPYRTLRRRHWYLDHLAWLLLNEITEQNRVLQGPFEDDQHHVFSASAVASFNDILLEIPYRLKLKNLASREAQEKITSDTSDSHDLGVLLFVEAVLFATLILEGLPRQSREALVTARGCSWGHDTAVVPLVLGTAPDARRQVCRLPRPQGGLLVEFIVSGWTAQCAHLHHLRQEMKGIPVCCLRQRGGGGWS